MEKVYTKENYAKAYTELIEILRNIPREDLNKVPKDVLKNYIENMDKNYTYKYDANLDFEEQEVSHLTQILIANLYIKYWADEAERQQIQDNEKKELYELELKKKDKYNPNNLFANREKQQVEEPKDLIVVKDKNILQKIISKIKEMFKKR